MPDLATAGAAQRLGLARGERRHVVVVHVALVLLGAEAVEALRIAHRAQCQDREAPRLAAPEHARTARPGQETDPHLDRADVLQAASAYTHALRDHARA